MKAIVALLSIIFLPLLVIGCKDDSASPGKNLEITNIIDNFQYQVSEMRNYTQTTTYAWRNTGSMANVNQSCAITGGTAVLNLFDSTGAQLYNHNLAENGSYVSTAGAASNWTVQLVLSNVTGTLNFRVQKRP